MPSKPRDPSKRTIYLDQSTLSDLVHGATVGRAQKPGDAVYKDMLPWVRHIAQTENLCLSLAHVVELGQWGDQGAANAAVELLDELPYVWLEIGQQLAEAEEEYWLAIAAGVDLRGRSPYFPSQPSLLSLLRPATPHIAANMLVNPTLRGLLEGARGRGSAQDQAFSQQVRDKIRADRDWANERGMTDKEKAERTGYNFRVDLRTRGWDAHTRLRNKPDWAWDYAETEVTQGQATQLLEDIYTNNPRSLPSFRIYTRFLQVYADLVRRRAPGSKGDRALDSSLTDATHISVGAAYCDVFTCDFEASKIMGDERQKLGFAPQMTVRGHGGPEGFVRAITAL